MLVYYAYAHPRTPAHTPTHTRARILHMRVFHQDAWRVAHTYATHATYIHARVPIYACARRKELKKLKSARRIFPAICGFFHFSRENAFLIARWRIFPELYKKYTISGDFCTISIHFAEHSVPRYAKHYAKHTLNTTLSDCIKNIQHNCIKNIQLLAHFWAYFLGKKLP